MKKLAKETRATTPVFKKLICTFFFHALLLTFYYFFLKKGYGSVLKIYKQISNKK